MENKVTPKGIIQSTTKFVRFFSIFGALVALINADVITLGVFGGVAITAHLVYIKWGK